MNQFQNWCAISRSAVVGPHFFEGNVNGEEYREMVANFFIPELRRRLFGSNQNQFFQQDGAHPHTATETNQMRNLFGNKFISLFAENPWPPRGPDLTAPDSYLWGHLEIKSFRKRTQFN